jgi:DNA topoisomerase-1
MYAQILKDSAASKEAWLKRTRAVHHTTGSSKTGEWVGSDGKPLGATEKKYLSTIPIPPGWTKVRISTDPKAELIAEGVDSGGKTQPKYSAAHNARVKVEKFARVAELNPKIGDISKQSEKDMNNKKLSERERDTAATVHLITKTGFRPGGSSVDAYGASSLEKRHIKVEGDASHFTFVGKHQVNITKKLTDANMASYLKEKLTKLGPNDTVFKASGASANAYLKKLIGDKFKVKDLRTWNGTAVARQLIEAEPRPKNEAELKAQQKRISKLVAAHLGNTPAVSLEHYIDPSLWYHTGGLNAKKKVVKT